MEPAGYLKARDERAGQAQPFWDWRFASGFASGMSRVGREAKRAGQVTVELLLVLPVFMLILFFIMEIGSLAYQTILVHHCAYELARIGSLVAGPRVGQNGGPDGGGNEWSKMDELRQEMLPSAVLKSEREDTLPDRQSPDHRNQDLKVTLTYPAKLVFPGSNYFLSDIPREQHIKKITVTVLMPIEQPFFE